MFRTSGLSAEIVAYLIDKPVACELDARPGPRVVAELGFDHRAGGVSSDGAFTHAVLGLAALSLSARSVLALRS